MITRIVDLPFLKQSEGTIFKITSKIAFVKVDEKVFRINRKMIITKLDLNKCPLKISLTKRLKRNTEQVRLHITNRDIETVKYDCKLNMDNECNDFLKTLQNNYEKGNTDA